MDDQYDHIAPHHKKHRRGGSLTMKAIAVGIIIVIILAGVFAYYFMGSAINVSSTTVLKVSNSGTVFSLGGSTYVANLASYNKNTNTAYVYVTALPVFLNPILNLTLRQNNTVKTSYNGQYAVMELTLISANQSGASIRISPLATSLQISPDYQYIGRPGFSLPGLSIPAYNSVSTTTLATTTISGSNSPTTTVSQGSTTVASTTIATNSTLAQIDAIVKTDRDYALMLNFSTLYANSKNCTPLQYNNTYFEHFASQPSGPLTYANVSYETPYGLVQKIVHKSGTTYAYEFVAQVQDPQFNSTVALETDVNTGTSSVVSDSFGGIFLGATYANVSSAYTTSKGVSGSCGVLVG